MLLPTHEVKELHMAIRKVDDKKPYIDIRGPAGNAFCILGTAQDLSNQLGHSKEHAKAIQDEMTSGDYEELLEAFDRHYGDFVDIVR